MSRTLRPLAALSMVALTIVISAGCGSNASSETGIARSAATTTTDQDRIAFSSGPRSRSAPGLRSVPGPLPGSPGRP